VKDVAPHDTLLFNLKQDAGEQTNLAKSHPEKVQELLAAMKSYQTRLEPTPPLVQYMPADKSHIQKYQERKAKSSRNE
jgi:hypothetical protein